MATNLTTITQVLFHIETGKTVLFNIEPGFGFIRISEDNYVVVLQPKGKNAVVYSNEINEEGKSKIEATVEHFMGLGLKFFVDDDIRIMKVTN